MTSDSTRAELIKAAKTLFAAKGFNGTTVKEIADHAGVNVSLVSYHFNGKEKLYRACLEEFGLDRIKRSERILKTASSAAEFKTKLEIFIEDFLVSSTENQEVTEIMHRECGLETSPVSDLFSGLFFKSFQILVHFFEDAKKKKILVENCPPAEAAMLLMGSLVSSLRWDKMNLATSKKSIHQEKYRAHMIRTVTDLFSQAYLRRA